MIVSAPAAIRASQNADGVYTADNLEDSGVII